MTRRRLVRARRGSALLLVLVTMVVLAILASASMMSAFQEARSSRAAQIQQRALTVAEFALNSQLSSWPTRRNSMATGAIDSTTVGVDLGDTAIVRVQRLSATDFNVVSVGRAGIGNGLMEAQREVSLLVKFTTPTIRPAGIITSFGNVDIQGSPSVSGRSTTPAGWTGCTAARDTFAISYNPSATASVQKPASQAVGGTYADPRAGNASNYDTFGSETWASLAAKANVRITAGISPTPSGNATTCNAMTSNWGEPWRGTGTVAGCYNYFPIIYSPGDLSLNGGRGQGILIVDGTLRITGNFEFVGLVLVRNELDGAGNFSLTGALMTRNNNGSATRLRGNATLAYSKCGVDQALSALAMPTRLGARAWANVY